ncbi:hypothetical protein NQ314_017925 [Rhamnusium bicolor]|uniref:Regulatory protein zeste n=1 Tax=Rhamnusium bicolor TaxID=1586634 RepID=A0AAV8WS52_9CUCU|nr:hypothetical protein NQ314_017925 [Rhamnusium bicolor]
MERKDRKRSSNYTQRGKEILLSLVETYMNVIENKKTNAVYNKQKAECWEKLAWEYNSTQTSGLRTGVQLKSCYEQLKKIAKQHLTDDKVEILKTGGGTFTPKISVVDEKVMSLLKDNYFSVENKYDNNARPVRELIPSTTSLGLSSSSSMPTATASTSTAAENIIIIYENKGNINSNDYVEITDQQHNDMTNSLEDITNRQVSTSLKINSKESEPERKKKKIVKTNTQQESKEKQGKDMRKKQIEVLECKMIY